MTDDYKGMSHDAEAEYNKRQAEPLFKRAKDLAPMEVVAKHFENLKCANTKRGCIIPKNHEVLPWCPVCVMLKAVGTDFFMYEGKLTEEMMWKMTDWQRDQYDQLRKYWTAWLDNYPLGVSEIPDCIASKNGGSGAKMGSIKPY